MKLAVMYSGQGSQKVGMGTDIYNDSPIGKDIFNKANTLLNRDIISICLNGPSEDLNQTKNTQIAITIISIALTLILKEELKKKNILFTPSCTCGHSLGEFSALWLIGFLSTDELIKLVSIRGNLMQNAPQGNMMAVLNLDESKIKNLIRESGGNITLANYNTPNQFVISGQKDNIEELTEKIKLTGGKAIILPVSGAFHSPLMEEASKVFNLEIDKLVLSNIKNISIPVYQNTDGNPNKDPLIIKEKLKKQMTSSVLWTQTINNLVKDGVTTVVEIGPGKILTGLVKKINPDIECHNINDLITLQEFILFYESKLQSTRQSKTT